MKFLKIKKFHKNLTKMKFVVSIYNINKKFF